MFKKLDALYEKIFGISFSDNSRCAWGRVKAVYAMSVEGAKKFPSLIKELFEKK